MAGKNGDNPNEPAKFEKQEQQSFQRAEQGAAQAFRDELHLSQKDSQKVVKEIVADDKNVENLKPEEIQKQLAQIATKLESMSNFLFKPDPELGTSFMDRMKAHDPELAKTLTDSFKDSAAGKYVPNYESGAIKPGSDNKDNVQNFLKQLQS